MASRDLHNKVKATRGLSPAAAITGNGASSSQIIDTQSFESVEFLFATGAVTDGTWAMKLQDGDAANLSDAADVVAADLLGATFSMTTTDANTVKKLGYKGNKRYVKAVATQSGATSGGFLAIVALLGDAKNAPVA